MSEAMIGLTIVAAGTSMPEHVTYENRIKYHTLAWSNIYSSIPALFHYKDNDIASKYFLREKDI